MKNKKGLVLSILLVFFISGVTIPLFMTNHKKVKADTITDLTNTTWIFNNSIPYSSYSLLNMGTDDIINFNISFTSNNTQYTVLSIYTGLDIDDHEYKYLGFAYTNSNQNPYTQVYSIFVDYSDTSSVLSTTWLNDNYKTIEFTGGTAVTSPVLISWLQSNATLQTPPTPTGTQITKKYWSPYGIITMSDNQVIGDNDIQYTVLFNEFTSSYDETTQTGLIFKGVLTNQDPAWSYIESINGSGINILYHGTTNNINNSMWLEFTYGDYMDTNLYNFMNLWGHWFDDGDAYIVGMNQGYVEGTEHGRALGQADGVEYTNLVSRIFNGLGDILSIQIFPNITIGLLIGLPLLLGVFIIIIKILRG